MRMVIYYKVHEKNVDTIGKREVVTVIKYINWDVFSMAVICRVLYTR